MGAHRHRVFSHRVDIDGRLFWLLVLQFLFPVLLLGAVLFYGSGVVSDVRQMLPLVMGKVARWAQR